MNMVDDSAGIFHHIDGQHRCWWCQGHDDYVLYHDDEWAQPVDDDRRLFEKICLEGFQSGLSWLTILRKRDNFRKAFRDFDFHAVAKFKDAHVTKLLTNEGIVRHRGKIEATINNARRAIEMEREFGSLAAWFWQHEPTTAWPPADSSSSSEEGKPLSSVAGDTRARTKQKQTAKQGRAPLKSKAEACQRTTCDEAITMSKELKKRGWKFVGPTTAYAFMQAMGMVNDHLVGCCQYEKVEQLRRKFRRPRLV